MTKGTARRAADPASVAAALRREIDSGHIELPLLPSVAAEVLSSSLDDQSDAARLAELIQQDQSLATHVLRVVNSPAFRGATEILALQQAIARLGMERIREIALSASLKGSLFRKGPYQGVADECWQVALAAGLWAKEVARASRRNVEIAYLCGLLHNIGAPLLLHRLGELAPDLDRAAVAPLLEALGPAAGLALAREWQLPRPVQVCIEMQNRFAEAGDDQDLVAVAECGIALGRWMCTRSILVAEVQKLPAIRHLNLYPEDVDRLLALADGVRASLESMR